MLNRKVAVITGGAKGIGRAIAQQLAQNGTNIALIDYGQQETADALCATLCESGIHAAAYQCNVADYKMTKTVCGQIFADFGRIDILINNAGITKDNLLLRMSETDFDSVINVNLKGAFNLIKHLSRPLMKSPEGRIINISSVSGLMGNPGQANYSASKAGLIGLTKTVAKEFAPRGVTCNAIAPGFIETDMTAELPDSVKASLSAVIPLQHMGKPEDIAQLVAFLVSEQAAYITGEVIRVDGGMAM